MNDETASSPPPQPPAWTTVLYTTVHVLTMTLCLSHFNAFVRTMQTRGKNSLVWGPFTSDWTIPLATDWLTSPQSSDHHHLKPALAPAVEHLQQTVTCTKPSKPRPRPDPLDWGKTHVSKPETKVLGFANFGQGNNKEGHIKKALRPRPHLCYSCTGFCVSSFILCILCSWCQALVIWWPWFHALISDSIPEVTVAVKSGFVINICVLFTIIMLRYIFVYFLKCYKWKTL